MERHRDGLAQCPAPQPQEDATPKGGNGQPLAPGLIGHAAGEAMAAGVAPGMPSGPAPRAPWRRKGWLYRMFDALPAVRWSRYCLRRSRYAWARQRAGDRLGVAAFTLVEHAVDAAMARFARSVSLRHFAHGFTREPGFRDTVIHLVHTLAAPELTNPMGTAQRLNMVALSDLDAWHLAARQAGARADHQLGAELVMLAIPAGVFEQVVDQLRELLEQHQFTDAVPARMPAR